jgi:ribonuclease D
LYITEASQLDTFISHARHSKLLAIDTEFLREKTYWPRLCLIQLGTEDEFVAVDPFAVTDLSPLRELFEDEGITKIFHAAHQDLDIIYHELGIVPHPLFDTQVAASLLGHTLQIGYGALVLNECGVRLKKADSFTDWSRRPLTASQIDYALDDVRYLPPVYHSLVDKLTSLGRLDWLDKDFEDLADPSHYAVDSRDRWRHLKRANQLTPRQLSAAREVAAWREDVSVKRNIPRKWTLSDEQIVEICKREPRTVDDLYLVRGVSKSLNKRDAKAVLACCTKGLDAPQDTWPVLNQHLKNEPNVDAVVELYSALVHQRARENDVAFAVLASHDDLVNFARGHYEDLKILKGWRRHMVGDEMLELAAGRLTLSIRDGELVVKPVEDPAGKPPEEPPKRPAVETVGQPVGEL